MNGLEAGADAPPTSTGGMRKTNNKTPYNPARGQSSQHGNIKNHDEFTGRMTGPEGKMVPPLTHNAPHTNQLIKHKEGLCVYANHLKGPKHTVAIEEGKELEEADIVKTDLDVN